MNLKWIELALRAKYRISSKMTPRCYIFPDGNFLQLDEFNSHADVERWLIDHKVVKEGPDSYSGGAPSIEDKGAIRCNLLNEGFIMLSSVPPTSAQYEALTKYLDEYLPRKSMWRYSDGLMLLTPHQKTNFKTYNLDDYTTDDIISIIRDYYSYGVLKEDFELTESKADTERFISWGGQDLYNKFMNLKARLKGQESDMYYWMKKSPEELENKLNELEQTKTVAAKSAEAKEGAETIYEDNSWLVLKINTYEASVKYGKGTKWCISGEYDGHEREGQYFFNDYLKKGVIGYYFFINRQSQDKWCVTVYGTGDINIFNAKDEQVLDIPNAPKIDGVYTGLNTDTLPKFVKDAISLYAETLVSDWIDDTYGDEESLNDLKNDLASYKGFLEKLRYWFTGGTNVTDQDDEILQRIAEVLSDFGFFDVDEISVAFDRYQKTLIFKFLFECCVNELKRQLKITEDLSPEQDKFFSSSVLKNIKVYHSGYEDFKEFHEGKLIWFAKDEYYAKELFGDGNHVYECYINLQNPFRLDQCGDINDWFFDEDLPWPDNFNFEDETVYQIPLTETAKVIAKNLGVDTKTLTDMFVLQNYCDLNQLYFLTRSEEFAELLKQKGYDGVIAIEGGYTTYGVLNANQIKSTSNSKPTASKNIDESIARDTCIYRGESDNTLSKKFDNASAGIFFGDLPSHVEGWGDVTEYKIIEPEKIYDGKCSSDEYCTNNNLYDKEFKELHDVFGVYLNIKKLKDIENLYKDFDSDFDSKKEFDKKVANIAGDNFVGYDVWTWCLQLVAKLDLASRGYKGACWYHEDFGNSKQYQIWDTSCIDETGNYDFSWDDNFGIDYDESLKEQNKLEEKIVKVGSKWQVQSEKGRNMGTYDTKAEAEKRLQQVHYFKSMKESAAPSMQDELADIDNTFGQSEPYYWSTYILPNGHFLNPDNDKDYWDELEEEPSYEHDDFISYEYNNFGERLFDDCIKLNATFPYLAFPKRITNEQKAAVLELLKQPDSLLYEQPIHWMANDYDIPIERLSRMQKPLMILMPDTQNVFDMSVQSGEDVMKAVAKYYSTGKLDNDLFESVQYKDFCVATANKRGADYKKFIGESVNNNKDFEYSYSTKRILVSDFNKLKNLIGDYKLEKVPMADIIRDTGIDKDVSMKDRREKVWGKSPDEYHFNSEKNDYEVNNPIRLERSNGKYRILDGNHRLRALANDGYNSVEAMVKTISEDIDGLPFFENDNTIFEAVSASEFVTVFTYQSDEVLEILKSGKTYIADYDKGMFNNYEDENPYKSLAKIFGLHNCPIFCGFDVDTLNEMIRASGLDGSDRINLLELKVPVNEIKCIPYYDWTDYIYALEDPEEFEAETGWSLAKMEDYLKQHSRDFNVDVPQVVIDRIEPEWLVNKNIKESVDMDYDGRGWILPSGEIYNTLNGPHADYEAELWDYEGTVENIRYNFGYERYIKLPSKKPTEAQMITLTELLDMFFVNANNVGIRSSVVDIEFNDKISRFWPTETSVDELIKKINAAYNSGVLVEDLETSKHKAITFGDLDYGKKTDTKDMMGGRGTGHFGTGFYFVGKDGPNGLDADGNIKRDYNRKRPVYEIDLEAYKLFKPVDNDTAYRIHDSMKVINSLDESDFKYIFKNNYDADKIEDEMYQIGEDAYSVYEALDPDDYLDDLSDLEIDDSELVDTEEKPVDTRTEEEKDQEYEKVFREKMKDFINKYDLELYIWDYGNLDNWLNTTKLGKIEQDVAQAIKKRGYDIDSLEYHIDDLAHIFGKSRQEMLNIVQECAQDGDDVNTLSTKIFKKLGYEGVDVTHLNHDAQGLSGLDNFSYGTVIYDLKPGTFRRIIEPRE